MKLNNSSEPEAPSKIEGLILKPLVARRAGVSVRTVDEWIRHKRIPSIKIGRTIRFRWAAVEAALLKYERHAIT